MIRSKPNVPQITQEELKKVVANMGNVTTLSASGIVLGGTKYM